MELWHRSMLQAWGRLRAEQLLREAEEWRAARLASQSISRERSGLAHALAWWRAQLSRRRAQRVPLAEQGDHEMVLDAVHEGGLGDEDEPTLVQPAEEEPLVLKSS